MKITTHHHRPITEAAVEPWFGCVAPDIAHSELTHGGTTLRTRCRVCGAVLLSEKNGDAVTVGHWSDPDDELDGE